MKVNIATAPVSWGVLMKDTPNVPPYTQVLDEIRASGYMGTELGPIGFLPLDIDQVRAELAQRDLRLISAFIPIHFRDPKGMADVYDEAITVLQSLSELGCEWAVLSDSLFVDDKRAKRAGRIRPQDGLDEAASRQFARNVEDVCKMIRDEYGLKSALHPHVGSYLETAQEIDNLLTYTDPDLVGLCFDMAHITYGGGDPVAILQKWGERVITLHIKECSQKVLDEVLAREGDYYDGVSSNVFPELGQGTVDFLAIRDLLIALDFEGWGTVEQDILPNTGADPLASAKRNRAYLQETLKW